MKIDSLHFSNSSPRYPAACGGVLHFKKYPWKGSFYKWGDVGPFAEYCVSINYFTHYWACFFSNEHYNLLISRGEYEAATPLTADYKFPITPFPDIEKSEYRNALFEELNKWREKFGRPETIDSNSDPDGLYQSYESIIQKKRYRGILTLIILFLMAPTMMYCSYRSKLSQAEGYRIEAKQEVDSANVRKAYKKALKIYEKLDEDQYLADTLVELAWFENNLKKYENAHAAILKAGYFFHKTGSRLGEAKALKTLSIVESKLGKMKDAVEHNLEAIGIYESIGYSKTGFKLEAPNE